MAQRRSRGPMTRRRIITRVIVLLLLGAVINVAVAWGCELWSPVNSCGPNSMVRVSGKQWWSARFADGYDPELFTWEVSGLGVRGTTYFGGDDWGCAIRRSGWPLIAMEYAFESCGEFRVHHGIEVPNAIPRKHNACRYVPTRIVWRGLLPNAAFYAAALWLVFCVGPGLVRRRIRRGRGLCLHCGYDLRGQRPGAEAGASRKCPECGRSA